MDHPGHGDVVAQPARVVPKYGQAGLLGLKSHDACAQLQQVRHVHHFDEIPKDKLVPNGLLPLALLCKEFEVEEWQRPLASLGMPSVLQAEFRLKCATCILRAYINLKLVPIGHHLVLIFDVWENTYVTILR